MMEKPNIMLKNTSLLKSVTDLHIKTKTITSSLNYKSCEALTSELVFLLTIKVHTCT